MTDAEVYLGFQLRLSVFPHKNDDFNYIIKMMIKRGDSSVISQSFLYS